MDLVRLASGHGRDCRDDGGDRGKQRHGHPAVRSCTDGPRHVAHTERRKCRDRSDLGVGAGEENPAED